jgi:hypothetical protein
VDFSATVVHTIPSAHGCNPAAPLFSFTRPKRSNSFDGRAAAWDRGKLLSGARQPAVDMRNSLENWRSFLHAGASLRAHRKQIPNSESRAVPVVAQGPRPNVPLIARAT